MAGTALSMEANCTAALSELAEKLRGDERARIRREEFEAIARRHFSGSHGEQQMAQLWEKARCDRNLDTVLGLVTLLPQICTEDSTTIGQAEVCSFLLREMQQRESQMRAHHILPLPHHPSFSSVPNTKVSFTVGNV